MADPAVASLEESWAVPATIDVDIGDGTLSCVVAGSGMSLVMLHGWTLDHRSWLPQLPLAEHTKLILPDRRGFGRSTAPPGLAMEWRDIDKLTDSTVFVLLGLSQGASVALDYARYRPDRLAGLIVVGAPLHGVVPNENEETAIPRARYEKMVRSGRLHAMKADWAKSALLQTSAPLLDAMLDDYDGRDLLAERASLAFSAADIATLPMPVLALCGADDTPWRRRVSDFIGTTAKNGRSTRIERAGHLCNLDNPTLFNAILTDFLRKLSPQKALC